LAKRANASIAKKSSYPSTKLRIIDVEAQSNYTLKINYQVFLKDRSLVDDFKELYYMKAKKKFCKNNFYKRMKDGLKINLIYYNHKNEHIASFHLDKKKCCDINAHLNTLY
jgi:hypothetical protein